VPQNFCNWTLRKSAWSLAIILIWMRAVGFKTAFVKRPDEWGAEGPPDPEPNPIHDIVVDSFPELATALGA